MDADADNGEVIEIFDSDSEDNNVHFEGKLF